MIYIITGYDQEYKQFIAEGKHNKKCKFYTGDDKQFNPKRLEIEKCIGLTFEYRTPSKTWNKYTTLTYE